MRSCAFACAHSDFGIAFAVSGADFRRHCGRATFATRAL
jgi:hypothetical protein